MRLIQPTAAQWARQMQAEATREGLRVVFTFSRDVLTAAFFNHDIYCYDRIFTWRGQ